MQLHLCFHLLWSCDSPEDDVKENDEGGGDYNTQRARLFFTCVWGNILSKKNFQDKEYLSFFSHKFMTF